MKKLFTDNIGLKVVSALLAVFLWFFVTYRGQSEMVVEAPVEFKNVPKAAEILKQSLKDVRLNIRAQENVLKDIRPMDIRVLVDLAGLSRGDHTLYFDKSSVAAPRGVEVLRIDPASVRVTLDESVRKSVPVKPYIIGRPESGFKVRSVNINPSAVEIEGPRVEISKISILRTEPIDLTGLDSKINQSIKINANGRNVRLTIPETVVTIDIVRTN
ncbi:MAG: CdaR family protein [Dissulfurispiraceae bacterium]|jgi:YbbR domain-containing protein|nr:CdaR family protein [Dissulfurispiraceae bacterium]